MNLNKKKILVTGGLGFIGTNLIKKLKNLGAEVNSYDKRNGQDIRDSRLILKTIKKQYDFIYHLAAFSGNQQSISNNTICFDVNTMATISMLETIVKISPQTKIILSSSRLEYGNPIYLPVDEKHPTQANSPYGLSKLLATKMATIFSKKYNLKFTTLRTSNVYGPHKKSKFLGYNLVNYFIDTAKSNGIIKIFGAGTQLRDYLYIDDAIDAFLKTTDPISNSQIYNLGSGRGISVLEMAKTVISTVGKGKIKKVIWPKDWKKVETGNYISNISKIKNELNFQPQISLKEGLNKIVNEI